MPRPKKEQPNRADGLYEVKITVGKTFQGKLIRKSFYSSTSKDDAKKQADKFKIEQKVASRTGITKAMESKNFAKWAKEWLLSIKGTVKDSTYHLTYTNSMEVIVDHPKTAFSARDLPMSKEIESLLKARPRSIVVGYNEHKKKNGKMVATDFVFYNQLGQVCSPRTWSRRHYDVFMEEMPTYYLMCQSATHMSCATREPHFGLMMTKIFSRLQARSVGETSKCSANDMRTLMLKV